MGSAVIAMSTDATTGDSIGLQTRQERRHHGVVLLERLHVVALGSRGEQGLDARHERGDDDRLGVENEKRGETVWGKRDASAGSTERQQPAKALVHAACPTEASVRGRRRRAMGQGW